jgi:hypothetical protein
MSRTLELARGHTHPEEVDAHASSSSSRLDAGDAETLEAGKCLQREGRPPTLRIPSSARVVHLHDAGAGVLSAELPKHPNQKRR